jgi:aspartokinase-like uncharacterized kinase
MTSGNLFVVKLGGSLAGYSDRLGAIMNDIATAASTGVKVVIVPGGGSFADAVRQEQLSTGFDDATAHDMALLAMAQTGCLYASLTPRRARLAWGSPAVVAALAERTCVPIVWQPDPRSDGIELERSWNVTSDSLALWLANKLGAAQVILVKSCAAPEGERVKLTELARLGIIDRAYPLLAAGVNGVETTLIYAGQSVELNRALAASN